MGASGISLFPRLVLALIVGYLIPVLASLFFSVGVGKYSPKRLSEAGCLKGSFIVMHAFVWALASAVSGYVIGSILPSSRAFGCIGAAGLLILVLLMNMGEMKKTQTAGRIGGMILATVLGLGAGLQLFLKVGVPSQQP